MTVDPQPPARVLRPEVERLLSAHLQSFLLWYQPELAPLDRAWRSYHKIHKKLGRRDRNWLVERLYWHEKRRHLMQHLWQEDIAARIPCVANMELPPEAQQQPLHMQCGVPKALYDLWSAQYGTQVAEEQARISLESAPLYIRANSLRITRERLIEQLPPQWNARSCPESAAGIELIRGVHITDDPDYEQGLFEIQDLGSQKIAELVCATPGDEVLDMCAGGGGKSLAMAAALQGRGQLHLYDIRAHALQDAKKRLKRAGVQNAQCHNQETLALLKRRCDWVLVDAPCSGTGTLRRNPEMKHRFCATKIDELQQLQRTILEQAEAYVSSTGRLVYATCSTLELENQVQRRWLEARGWCCEREWFCLPKSNGMDGFYGAVFHR